MANRETLLRWQVIGLLKNDGYFCLEFTEKRLHNLLNEQNENSKEGIDIDQLQIEQNPRKYFLLFEEPELFLHPRGQHILFNALKTFSIDNQVLVTTHSPMFFGAGATETFVKIRKTPGLTNLCKPFTQVQPIDLSDMKAKDQFQIICFENNNAAFFADTVVLVEGDSDYLLFPHIAKILNPNWDVAQKPIQFARITGKGNIRRYREFFARFNVRVPVIADLDLLINGFDHIKPNEEMKLLRDSLLTKVDETIKNNTGENYISSEELKNAIKSSELKCLWERVGKVLREFKSGECTQEEFNKAIEDFSAWQRKSDRIGVLKNCKDRELLELKWKLLALLRTNDIYILERGEIENYYPISIIEGDKPSRAQDFCAKINTSEKMLDCCGMQEFEQDGIQVKENEFKLIFRSIFEGNK